MTTEPRTQTHGAGLSPDKPRTAVGTSEIPPVPPQPPTAQESSEPEEPEREKSINELMEQMKQELYGVVDKYVDTLREMALSSLPITTESSYEQRKRVKEQERLRRIEQQQERALIKQKLSDILKGYNIGDSFTLQELSDSTGINTTEISHFLVSHKGEWGIERDQNIRGKYFKIREVGKERIRMSQDMPQAEERLRSAILKYPIGAEFTLDDLSEATGYTPKSIRAYLHPQYLSYPKENERMSELGIEEKWLSKKDKYGLFYPIRKVFRRIQQPN